MERNIAPEPAIEATTLRKPESRRSTGALRGAPLLAHPAWPLGLSINVSVKKPTYHALVLGVMLRGFGLEELDTFFAQSQSNLGILDTCRRIVTD